MKDWPLFYAPDVKEQLALPEAEAQHALRVLRVRPGDELLATDGRGALYELRVTATDRRHCLVELTHEERWQPYWRGRLTLALAPTKSMERIEWTLEKAVELGVDELILLRVKHSERKHTNVARLERIIESAMKQSHKAWLPALRVDVPFAELLEEHPAAVKLIAHCRSELQPQRRLISDCWQAGADTLLAIGPEGDFTEEELQRAFERGYQPITLGESRLRTETAGLVALQWLHTLDQMDRSAQSTTTRQE